MNIYDLTLSELSAFFQKNPTRKRFSARFTATVFPRSGIFR